MPDLMDAMDVTSEEVVEPIEGETPAEGETPVEGETPTDETPVTSLFQADGKRLDPAVLGAITKIKEGKIEGVKPEVGKLLSKAVFRIAELDREFPGGLAEAKGLRDKIEEFGGISAIEDRFETLNELEPLAAQYMASDPAFVEDMVESSPEAFATLAPMIFDRYAKEQPDGFSAYMGRAVYGDLIRAEIPLLMARLQDVLGDPVKAAPYFDQLNQYLGAFKTMADKAAVAPKPKAEPRQTRDTASDTERRENWEGARREAQLAIIRPTITRLMAGRKPDTEDRAQMELLFQTKGKELAEKYFPGWGKKAQAYFARNDKEGFKRYMLSIDRRVAPEAVEYAIRRTMKAAVKAAAGAGGGKPTPGTPQARQATPGAQKPGNPDFKPVSAEPGTYDIDYSRTSTVMLRENRAILTDGSKVKWR